MVTKHPLQTHCLEEGEECESGFLCNSTRKCIPKRLLCDQTDDCGDSSDEIPGCLPWDSCSEYNGMFKSCGASFIVTSNSLNCLL